MSESFAEHRYYSLAPQVTAKTRQRILEAGMSLLGYQGRIPPLPDRPPLRRYHSHTTELNHKLSVAARSGLCLFQV